MAEELENIGVYLSKDDPNSTKNIFILPLRLAIFFTFLIWPVEIFRNCFLSTHPWKATGARMS